MLTPNPSIVNKSHSFLENTKWNDKYEYIWTIHMTLMNRGIYKNNICITLMITIQKCSYAQVSKAKPLCRRGFRYSCVRPKLLQAYMDI